MPFEIRYPNGEKISMTTLNLEAAAFWGIANPEGMVYPIGIVELDDDPETYTWDRIIGGAIEECPARINPLWKHVKEELFMCNIQDYWESPVEEIIEAAMETLDYLKPYYELIDLWKSKDYIPVKIKR